MLNADCGIALSFVKPMIRIKPFIGREITLVASAVPSISALPLAHRQAFA